MVGHPSLIGGREEQVVAGGRGLPLQAVLFLVESMEHESAVTACRRLAALLVPATNRCDHGPDLQGLAGMVVIRPAVVTQLSANRRTPLLVPFLLQKVGTERVTGAQ